MSPKEGERVALAMRRGVVMRTSEHGFWIQLDSKPEDHQTWVENGEPYLEESLEGPPPANLRDELESAINRWSAENGSNTPDFVLANFLHSCLLAFDAATKRRDDWWQNISRFGPAVGDSSSGSGGGEAVDLSDRPTANPSEPIPLPPIYEGMRVYHRQPDMFATVVAVDLTGKDKALVKYEWPNDPKADAVEVRRSELVPAVEVER